MASSSQVNTFDAEGLTTLPLKKFSYVTTPASCGKLLWTHLPQRDNLFAVFDFVIDKDLEGLIVKKRFLRFVRGDEILVCRSGNKNYMGAQIIFYSFIVLILFTCLRKR